MAKVKTFKTIFPAVSVPLNDDYSINEPEFSILKMDQNILWKRNGRTCM